MTPTKLQNVEQAAGNLEHVHTMRTHFLSLVDMLKAEILILDRASLDVIESILGQTGGRNSRPISPLETDDAADAAPRQMRSPLETSTDIVPATPTAIQAADTFAPTGLGAAQSDAVTTHLGAAPTSDTIAADATETAFAPTDLGVVEAEAPATDFTATDAGVVEAEAPATDFTATDAGVAEAGAMATESPETAADADLADAPTSSSATVHSSLTSQPATGDEENS